MRELIRPGILWVARLGLLLSILAAMAGQYQAWSFTIGSDLNRTTVEVKSAQYFLSFSQIGLLRSVARPVSQAERKFVNLAGIQVSSIDGRTWIWGEHYVVIAAFAMFYACLQLCLRRRPVATRCIA